MKLFRNTILFISVTLIAFNSFAQFNSAQIGVDGLTCSACTRSVEMSIRKLNFVDSVIMNLEHTSGKIIFKKGAKVEIDKIAKAVTDAGFSLRSLNADIFLNDLKVSNDFCWLFQNSAYHFIKIAESKQLKGIITIKFIGEKYMAKKEFKEWKSLCTNSCVLPSDKVLPSSKIYYVSLL